MKASSTSVAVWWMLLFLLDKLGATVCDVRLITPPIESHSTGVMSSITCNANRFTLALESFKHGMNLSNI